MGYAEFPSETVLGALAAFRRFGSGLARRLARRCLSAAAFDRQEQATLAARGCGFSAARRRFRFRWFAFGAVGGAPGCLAAALLFRRQAALQRVHQIDDLRRLPLGRLVGQLAFELLVDQLPDRRLVVIDEFAG